MHRPGIGRVVQGCLHNEGLQSTLPFKREGFELKFFLFFSKKPTNKFCIQNFKIKD